MNKRAFSLLELIVVLLIIGIMAIIALPQFRTARENALLQEAKSILKLIQAAEKIYGVENNFYWAYGTTALINTGLKLDIPLNNNWAYSVDTNGVLTNFRARAVRGGASIWCIQRTDTEPNTAAACNPP
jgi:prepilin-type N-terminal cleavage/methylation domain-containing protein